jgi:TetR/AcrR family transcriptional repressor of nem operon
MARPKSFDEDTVLDQAVELFRERGYEGTSMADLEAHLQLGRQSLYNTFGDKRELYLKALDRYQRRASDTLLAALEAPDAGLDALRVWLEASVTALTAPGSHPGCFVVNSLVERPDDPPTAARCGNARRRVAAAVQAALTRAQSRGEISRERDVEGLTAVVMAHSYGVSVLARAGAPAAELRTASGALLAVIR